MPSSLWPLVVVAVAPLLTKADHLHPGAICEDASGLQGVCKILTECPSAKQQLENNEYPEICSYIGLFPVVCCPEPKLEQNQQQKLEHNPQQKLEKNPDKKLNLNPDQNKTEEGTDSLPTMLGKAADVVGSIAKKKCEEYASYVYAEEFSPALLSETIQVDQCDIKADALVVGGAQAKPKEFPHMAAVGFEKDGDIRYSCGGSLISPDYVLTVAHCLSLGSVPASWVLLGDLDRSTDTDDASPQRIRVAERIKHPDYKPPVRYHDIALLRLERPAEMSGYVRPACLHTEPTLDMSRDPVQTGWGRTAYQWFTSEQLLKTLLVLADHKTCAEAYASDSKANMPGGILDESQLCAGGHGHSACQGDSGGPLQLGTTGPDEPYCMYKVVGLSSFGIGCGDVPGVYTRVYHYVPWIEEIVWPEEKSTEQPPEDDDEPEDDPKIPTMVLEQHSRPTNKPQNTGRPSSTAEHNAETVKNSEKNDFSHHGNQSNPLRPNRSPLQVEHPKRYKVSSNYPVWA